MDALGLMAAESRCDELRDPGFVNLVVSMQVLHLPVV
jgi:hypothetical protein